MLKLDDSFVNGLDRVVNIVT